LEATSYQTFIGSYPYERVCDGQGDFANANVECTTDLARASFSTGSEVLVAVNHPTRWGQLFIQFMLGFKLRELDVIVLGSSNFEGTWWWEWMDPFTPTRLVNAGFRGHVVLASDFGGNVSPKRYQRYVAFNQFETHVAGFVRLWEHDSAHSCCEPGCSQCLAHKRTSFVGTSSYHNTTSVSTALSTLDDLKYSMPQFTHQCMPGLPTMAAINMSLQLASLVERRWGQR
jgi:hypothetical protein